MNTLRALKQAAVAAKEAEMQELVSDLAGKAVEVSEEITGLDELKNRLTKVREDADDAEDELVKALEEIRVIEDGIEKATKEADGGMQEVRRIMVEDLMEATKLFAEQRSKLDGEIYKVALAYDLGDISDYEEFRGWLSTLKGATDTVTSDNPIGGEALFVVFFEDKESAMATRLKFDGASYVET